METTWSTALWRQFGAAIDMLENALLACPTALWKERVWSNPPDSSRPPEFAEFWYIVYHALFWFDLYLSGLREEEFTPPPPFAWAELDPTWELPEQPYTREALHTYLQATRRQCRAILFALTDEQAHRIVDYPWAQGQAVSFLELQLYNMRHVQEHAAQLNLFLGQRAVPSIPNSLAFAKEEPGN